MNDDVAVIEVGSGELLWSGRRLNSGRDQAVKLSADFREVALCQLVEEQNVTMWHRVTVYYNGTRLKSRAVGR